MVCFSIVGFAGMVFQEGPLQKMSAVRDSLGGMGILQEVSSETNSAGVVPREGSSRRDPPGGDPLGRTVREGPFREELRIRDIQRERPYSIRGTGNFRAISEKIP